MDLLREAIMRSASLRGLGSFNEAIDLIDEALEKAPRNHDLRLNANLEGLRAAEEGGLTNEARRFAAAVAETDPNFPMIMKYDL